MERSPTTSRSLDFYYHINGDTFEKQYKEVLSGYREWKDREHAAEWLVFPENTGPRLCIDETSISDGELYTIVSNPDARGKKGSLVAIINGVKSEHIINILRRKIPFSKRLKVNEITLDMSNSMRRLPMLFPQPSDHRPFPYSANGLRGRAGIFVCAHR